MKFNLYLAQKSKARAMIKEEMEKHEMKVAKNIRHDKGRGKKIWDNIDKLREKMKTTQNIHILYDSDEQVLSEADANNCVEHYWTDIYQKHHNDINEVWYDLSRRAYQDLIEEETQEEDSVTHDLTKFPIILREHFDSTIPIEKKITPIKNPKITTQELKSHLKSIKSRKATGSDDLKGELYEAFAQSDACTTVLKARFQDILDNNKEVPAWKKSMAMMVPKTKKATVQKLRPIALTDVPYKSYMKIIGSKIDQHILKQQEKMDNQAGFTQGSQI